MNEQTQRSGTTQRGHRGRGVGLWIGVLLLVVLTPPDHGWAQTHDPGDTPFCAESSLVSLDEKGLQSVYCSSSPLVTRPLHAAHRSANVVFYSGVPAAWIGAWALRDNGDFADAYRLTGVQLATYGVVTGLKRVVGRPRPFVTQALTSRSGRYTSADVPGAYESFPSGHASWSVALATSWSLSHPRWYVIAPSAVWATAVAVSRLRLGVHYPTDVLAGAVLGAGIATAVHLLRDAITPSALQPEGTESAGPTMTLRVQF